MRDEIEHALNTLREGHPDMERLFMEGQCYTLARMLQILVPGSEIRHDPIAGHVYLVHHGRHYDIRGKHLNPPTTHPLDYRMSHAPHRWAACDRRRLNG